MHFDLIIAGGSVIDGTGQPRRRADLGIQGDRIAAIDRLDDAQAALRIDARGLSVAPGFIDVHNHSAGWLLRQGHLESKTRQGFTSEVLCSDGIAYAPVDARTAPEWIYYLRSLDGLRASDYRAWQTLDDYLRLLEGRTVQNVVALVPFANLRVLAMGWGRAQPDDMQMRDMQRRLVQAMEDGAAGLSTGLDYIAQCFASTAELVEVCRPMSSWQGLYVTHVRYKKGVLAGVEEALEIGRRAGVRVHLSHMKGSATSRVLPADAPADADEVFRAIDAAAADGVDVSFDVYPYLPGSTMLGSLLPYEVWEDGPLGAIARLRSPTLRARFAIALEAYPTPLDDIYIAWTSTKANIEFQGQSLGDYVRQRGLPAAEALSELLIEEGLAVLCVFRIGDDRRVDYVLRHPRAMIATDGIYFPDALVHPRQSGTAPRVLGPLVRSARLFSLEEAVHKLTAKPAERFGLHDRGVLRPGAFADIVLFSADEVADQATYEAPHEPPLGIPYVLVNGQVVVEGGEPVRRFSGAAPGQVCFFGR